MKSMIMIVSMLASTASFADGFVCQTAEQDLNIKAYNHVTPQLGTRSVAILVLSDPAVGAGRKTIAKFTDANQTVVSKSSSYEANVDLRFNDSGRKGELIAGTKLGQLKTITLDVYFSYAFPVAAGETVYGKLTLDKRNGDQITRQVECTRYLKNAE